MTADADASPVRVNGILAGLRKREWPEGETDIPLFTGLSALVRDGS
jgi:hypothetical protein